MSKSLTVSILLTLIFFADLLSIRQTFLFWNAGNVSNDGFPFVSLLAAQIGVAAALLLCGLFIGYKSFGGKH